MSECDSQIKHPFLEMADFNDYCSTSEIVNHLDVWGR